MEDLQQKLLLKCKTGKGPNIRNDTPLIPILLCIVFIKATSAQLANY